MHDADVPRSGDGGHVEQLPDRLRQRRVGARLSTLPPVLQQTPVRGLGEAADTQRQLLDSRRRQQVR